MNFINQGEMTRILGLIRYLNQSDKTSNTNEFLSVEVTCSDSNGDSLGVIKYCDGGDYAFYPNCDDDA